MILIFLLSITFCSQVNTEQLKYTITFSNTYTNRLNDAEMVRIVLETRKTDTDTLIDTLNVTDFEYGKDTLVFYSDKCKCYSLNSNEVFLRLKFIFKYLCSKGVEKDDHYCGIINFVITNTSDKAIYLSEDLEEFYKKWSLCLLNNVVYYLMNFNKTVQDIVKHMRTKVYENIEYKYIGETELDSNFWITHAIYLIDSVRSNEYDENRLYSEIEDLIDKYCSYKPNVRKPNFIYLISKTLYESIVEPADRLEYIPSLSDVSGFHIIKEAKMGQNGTNQ